jgi:hypothetical protein
LQSWWHYSDFGVSVINLCCFILSLHDWPRWGSLDITPCKMNTWHLGLESDLQVVMSWKTVLSETVKVEMTVVSGPCGECGEGLIVGLVSFCQSTRKGPWIGDFGSSVGSALPRISLAVFENLISCVWEKHVTIIFLSPSLFLEPQALFHLQHLASHPQYGRDTMFL